MSDQYEPPGVPGGQHQSMVDPTVGHDAWQLDVTTRLTRLEARLMEIITLLQQRVGGA